MRQDERRTVVVVDDHDLYVKGLVRLLGERGLTVVGTAGSGKEALDVVARTVPDVVLMDLGLPDISGVEATRRLTGAGLGVCVVVLTAMADEALLMDAIQAGAVGYVLKDAPVDEIVAAVHAAATGGALGGPPGPPTPRRRLPPRGTQV